MFSGFKDILHRLNYIRGNVLGINFRNSEYIFKHNPRELYPLVDDKILTKAALSKHGIPFPEMYFAVQSYFDLRTLRHNLDALSSFVIKPTNGFGGEGVFIITESTGDGKYRLADDSTLPYKKIHSHVQEILSGVYSLNQFPDTAICEYKINGRLDLMRLSYKGIPDIRILVFRGIPVMAMLRLSTRASKGKANLHQGGIGVGIDLNTGMTTHAWYGKKYILEHPDNGVALTGFQIPFWARLLEIAVQCHVAVPLGYLGVDLVIDEHLGPMVLELNARAGLQLQMANRIGIKKTLSELQTAKNVEVLDQAARIALGRDLFNRARAVTTS